jgi:hypothetical protein
MRSANDQHGKSLIFEGGIINDKFMGIVLKHRRDILRSLPDGATTSLSALQGLRRLSA